MAGEEEADNMGDLSMFLPSQTSSAPPFVKKEIEKQTQKLPKKKAHNWQEQRKLNREQKQKQEDEQTLTNCNSALPTSNIGFKMLQQMGYNPGSALGREGQGRVEPVGIEIKRSRAGLGREELERSKAKEKETQSHKKRKNEEEMVVEFGQRQKNQWRSRKIFVDYKKAKAALAQLENVELIEPEKKDGEDEEKEEEEEEEIITAEDLQDILMKLRDEHHYCLYCGCQYESAEALLSNCPGIEEDDH